MDLGHWQLFDGIKLETDTYSFVYIITHIQTGRYYVGKKQMVSRITRKPLKGNKNKRIAHKESDWKTYTSSSKELNEDILKYGKDQFHFLIIRACSCKWEGSFFELKEQMDRNVLFDDLSYNGIINIRLNKPPKKTKEIFLNTTK